MTKVLILECEGYYRAKTGHVFFSSSLMPLSSYVSEQNEWTFFSKIIELILSTYNDRRSSGCFISAKRYDIHGRETLKWFIKN